MTEDEEAKSYLVKGEALTKLEIARDDFDNYQFSNRTKKEEVKWLSLHKEVKKYYNGNLHKHYWTLLNGVKDGEFKLYEIEFPDTLAIWCNYSNGEKEGKYFSNMFDKGAEENYGTYHAGYKEGEWISCSQRYDCIDIHNYKNDELHGDSTSWTGSGKYIRTITYNKGVKI